MIMNYTFVRVSIFVPPTKTCKNISIRMVIKTSIDFLVANEEGRVCIRFTDFGSKFIRRVSGGLFSVKVAAGREMQTNHYP